MTGEQLHEAGLVDFKALAVRLRTAAGILGIFAVLGVVVDGLRIGLTFAVMVRWAGVFVLGMLVVTAVLVALHALRGADTAARRGESLSGPDIGVVPRRGRR
jgi:sugar phosphate permease